MYGINIAQDFRTGELGTGAPNHLPRTSCSKIRKWAKLGAGSTLVQPVFWFLRNWSRFPSFLVLLNTAPCSLDSLILSNLIRVFWMDLLVVKIDIYLMLLKRLLIRKLKSNYKTFTRKIKKKMHPIQVYWKRIMQNMIHMKMKEFKSFIYFYSSGNKYTRIKESRWTPPSYLFQNTLN